MEEKEFKTTEKAVKAKKKMEPKKKKITIAAVIVGIIAVIAILIGINQTAIMSDINYAFMPKSITPTVDGVQVEFFVYKNKDFNQFKDKNTPLMALMRKIFVNALRKPISVTISMKTARR